MPPARHATGPGRVNLIGDHTDYNGGLALPMAISLGVAVTFRPDSGRQLLVGSDAFPDLHVLTDTDLEHDALAEVEPPWLRLIAAMTSIGRPGGGELWIRSTLPVGAGLSSSAALCVALAAVFGIDGSPLDVARTCQEAEQAAGSPVGLMDPWVCAGGNAGHALFLDFANLESHHVAIPEDADVVVVDSGRARAVRGSAYAARVVECRAATERIGVLGRADAEAVASLEDPVLRRRARHVVTECRRVRDFAAALAAGDLDEAGRLMTDSHRSLAEDFEVSTPEMDELVTELGSLEGVTGARMTGAGFGGCVVLLARRGAIGAETLPHRTWRVDAVDGTLASGHEGPFTTPPGGRSAGR